MKLVTEKELVEELKICRATLWRAIKTGKIDKPFQLGEKCNRWDLDSVLAKITTLQ